MHFDCRIYENTIAVWRQDAVATKNLALATRHFSHFKNNLFTRLKLWWSKILHNFDSASNFNKSLIKKVTDIKSSHQKLSHHTAQVRLSRYTSTDGAAVMCCAQLLVHCLYVIKRQYRRETHCYKDRLCFRMGNSMYVTYLQKKSKSCLIMYDTIWQEGTICLTMYGKEEQWVVRWVKLTPLLMMIVLEINLCNVFWGSWIRIFNLTRKFLPAISQNFDELPTPKKTFFNF